MLDCSYPVENGVVRNWDDMEHLWNYTFYDRLQIDPQEHKILLTEPPLNPKANRELFLKYMYGHEREPKLCPSVFSLILSTLQVRDVWLRGVQGLDPSRVGALRPRSSYGSRRRLG